MRDFADIRLPLMNGWCPRFATRSYIDSMGFLSFLQLQTERDEDGISGRSAKGYPTEIFG